MKPSPIEKNQTIKSRSSLRQRLSFTMIATGLVLLTSLIISGVVSYYSIDTLRANKTVDTWAIMFLELERQGYILQKFLEGYRPIADSRNKAVSEIDLESSADGILDLRERQVRFLKGFTVRSMRKDTIVKDEKLLVEGINIVKIQGETYLARYEVNSKKLYVWKLDRQALPLSIRKNDVSTQYVLTRDAKLVFANSHKVSELNAQKRPLVQKFIQTPLKQGQLEFTDSDGEQSYGFYYEVPGTNLVKFSEAKKNSVLKVVTEMMWKLIGFAIAIIVVSLLLLQFPMNQILAPVNELAGLAKRVGEGDFNVTTRLKSFGEIAQLSNAFISMSRSLFDRDEKIRVLMEEQKEHFRLASELAISKSIQENFLPGSDAKLPSNQLDIAAAYEPAAEASGDWYNYFFNEKAGESVIAIADVSGHGAGSAMFTAIIAGLFERYKDSGGATFPAAEFLASLNRVIYNLGRKQWHATVMIIKKKTQDNELHIFNCGHPFPFLSTVEGSKVSPKSIALSSDVVGLSPDIKIAEKSISFPSKSSLTLFTDGLIEAHNQSGDEYGKKRLKKTLESLGVTSSQQIVSRIHQDWNKHRNGRPAADDVCIITLRAA